jgi:glutaredoxin
MFLARSLLASGALGVLALGGLVAFDANAQQIYRIVGPDGRVTFSDQAPLQPGTPATLAKSVPLPSGGTEIASLPFELRQAAGRYPVSLYTAPDCAPCGVGRTMLANRGIPFTERTVTSREDIEALKRLAGGSPALPFLTIGGQQLKGYSETEWTQFLDAAGYPKTSQLPPAYVPAPALPLVAAQEPRAPRPAPATPPAAAAQAPAPAPAENPSGIRF